MEGKISATEDIQFEMMDSLTKKGVYMKMNISTQLMIDSVGFFTCIHPKAVRRVNPQNIIVRALRATMSLDEVRKVLKAGG